MCRYNPSTTGALQVNIATLLMTRHSSLCYSCGHIHSHANPLHALQVSDGAAATLMMTRREANRRGLPILGIFRSFAAVGVDPAIMGVGPAVAIPEAVKQAGLQVEDIDLFELNEAFASQVRASHDLFRYSLDSRRCPFSTVMATHHSSSLRHCEQNAQHSSLGSMCRSACHLQILDLLNLQHCVLLQEAATHCGAF